MNRCKHALFGLIIGLAVLLGAALGVKASNYGDCQYGVDVYGSCQSSPSANSTTGNGSGSTAANGATNNGSSTGTSTGTGQPSSTDKVTHQEVVNRGWVIFGWICLILALILLLITLVRRRQRRAR